MIRIQISKRKFGRLQCMDMHQRTMDKSERDIKSNNINNIQMAKEVNQPQSLSKSNWAFSAFFFFR